MKIVVITQARSNSTRLPGKILKLVNGESLLKIHLDRIRCSKLIDKVIVATTTNDADIEIVQEAKNSNVEYYRGSENNVLDRYYQSALKDRPDWVVRLTSDCPLIDPVVIDKVVNKAVESNLDYVSNTMNETYPDGQDVEVFRFECLEKAWKEAIKDSEKEHVTPYIKFNSTFYNRNLFRSHNVECEPENNHLANVRMTVDEINDFEVIKSLINKLGKSASWSEYAEYYMANKEISSLNDKILRNEGYIKSIEKE